MIRCTLELVRPNGDKKHLGTIEIANQLVETLQTEGKRGTYLAHIYKQRRGKVSRTVVIRDYPRLTYHSWNLIRRILNEAARQNGGAV